MSRRKLITRPSLAHFVESYGAEALRALVDDAVSGRPGSHTARRMGVSRERVSQWRAAWLQQETRWTPSAALERQLEKLDGEGS